MLIYMLSSLLVEFDRNEISVLRSRGASRFQICTIYFVEGMIIAGIALLCGFPLAFEVCRYLGVPAGFLTFNNRTMLQILWDSKILIYSLVAAVSTVVAIVLPAFFASKIDIIELKRSRSRKRMMEKWQLYFVDIALLAISAYGYFSYSERQKTVELAEVASVPVDPIIFIAIIAFIMGSALLFLRIYPYIIMLIFKLTKRALSAPLFCAFTQVGRGRGRTSYIMLFMITAIAVCLFSANSARSINTSRDNVLKYTNGANMIVMADWTEGNEFNPMAGQFTDETKYVPLEPPYLMFENLKGVNSLTKVYSTVNTSLRSGKIMLYEVPIMLVEPYNFGLTANMVGPFEFKLKDKTTDNKHFYSYLNQMTANEKGVLISSSVAGQLALAPGDYLQITVDGGARIDVQVLDVIDYWPSINPTINENFVIANFDYITSLRGVQPYEVWLNIDQNVSTMSVIKQLQDNGVPVLYARSVPDLVETDSKSAVRMGTNGILTLGFLVVIMVFVLGFMLYWILSIKSRALQFGILRSMGMSKTKLNSTLIIEQVMITGVAILFAIFAGGITSEMFIPFYEVAYSSKEQVPPFTTVMYASDYISIYLILAAILVIVFTILGIITSSTRINAAIKLGED